MDEYRIRKAAEMSLALFSMDATRRKVLTFIDASPPPTAPFFENYATFFSIREDTVPISANLDFVPAGATGILAAILLGWSWTLNLTFSRFDGDTLTGRLEGNLTGFHSDL